MSDSKRIVIYLPDNLLREVDHIVSIEKIDRSQFVCRAMRLYIRKRGRMELNEQMKNGYKEMGEINLALAELGLSLDMSSLETYEAQMAECE
ncbi:MAG: CopG family ribbon-helix-helix protein [Natronincolaceae bacterium]|jgi:CopG family transcriptional regulator/antitoxin EndoAI|nr:CopG family transcriptional regulator [Clostridiales bacterium]